MKEFWSAAATFLKALTKLVEAATEMLRKELDES